MALRRHRLLGQPLTQHRFDNDFGDERRRGHRVTIDGDVPV